MARLPKLCDGSRCRAGCRQPLRPDQLIRFVMRCDMTCAHPLEFLRSAGRTVLFLQAKLNATGCLVVRPAVSLFLLAMLGCLLVAPASAQERTDMGDLKSQVQELKEMVQQLQQETVASQAEITRLREELETQHANTTSSGRPQRSTRSRPPTESYYRSLGPASRPHRRRTTAAFGKNRRPISNKGGERVEISRSVLRNRPLQPFRQ